MSHIDVRESLLVEIRSWILSEFQIACHISHWTTLKNWLLHSEFFVKFRQGLASVYCIISKLSPTNPKFWCFMCMSCNPDIFKVEVCTVLQVQLCIYFHITLALKRIYYYLINKAPWKNLYKRTIFYTFCIMHMQHDALWEQLI